MLLGAHVPIADPPAAAAERAAEVVQVFLSSPRRWAPPKPQAGPWTVPASQLPRFVHSPYLLNLASPDEQVRTRSLTLLQATCTAAEAIGALGVVVHGGQLGAGEDPALGPARWRQALAQLETTVPVLVEDTAGGPHAVASTVERIARLWAGLHDVPVPLGFCLDTCHLHAAGEPLVAGTERLLAELGRIDLVHVNDSKDPLGSGRDRHENLGAGQLDPSELLAALELADAPAVVETPGGAEQQAADLAWLRARLPGADPKRRRRGPIAPGSLLEKDRG
ncbi:MAG: deoxyribonuclease IV [Nitriliruptoraceae bacterium]